MIVMASSVKGTTCGAAIFMRSGGIVHSLLSRSNSPHSSFGDFGAPLPCQGKELHEGIVRIAYAL